MMGMDLSMTSMDGILLMVTMLFLIRQMVIIMGHMYQEQSEGKVEILLVSQE